MKTVLALGDMLERNARRFRDRDAFICGERRLTHGGLLDQAKRLSAALYGLGLQRQDRVSILSTNSVEFCVAYAACEFSSLVAATVNFRLAPPEMAYIINDSQSSVLIFEAGYTDQVDQIRHRLTTIQHFIIIDGEVSWARSWDDVLSSADPEMKIPSGCPEDLAYLIYTSGTTGRPKGVMLDHAAAVAIADVCGSGMQLGSQDRTLLMMPIFHIGAKAIALGQQWFGGTVYLHKAFDPLAVLQTIDNNRITATHMAPTLIEAMLEVPNLTSFDVKSLKMVLYSAAPMPPITLSRALATFGPIFQQMYGQTEGIGTILPSTSHILHGSDVALKRITSIGFPFIGHEVSIIDDEENHLSTGNIGEICIRSPAMMRGYWNNSAASIKALLGGWLHTGDVGYIDEDGYIYLVDRKKDVIISGGENIYSREVEEALLTHPAVAAVGVIGSPDPKWGESVTAMVVLRKGASVMPDELIEHCRSQIAGYKRPRRIAFIDEMPLLPSGKISKPILRQMLDAMP